ncbi:hypothetical protein ACWIWK_04540 [Helicobacter sp. 23-1048]
MNDKKALKALYGAHNHQMVSTHDTSNALLSQILQKAREFDSPLFGNVVFLQSLIAMYGDNETNRVFANHNAIAEIIEWIIETEHSAQMS